MQFYMFELSRGNYAKKSFEFSYIITRFYLVKMKCFTVTYSRTEDSSLLVGEFDVN